MSLQTLGYIGLRTKNLEDWTAYASRFLGMQLVDKSRGTASFRMDDRKQRLVVNQADAEAPGFYGWEVTDGAALDARKIHNVTGVSVDDPDGNLVENYSCKSERNYTQYCNADVDRLLAAQSGELDKEKRRKMVWDIERLLVEDAARPIILHASAGNCWQPHVKNFRPHDNSQYNNLRFEDVWLDK